MLAASISSIGLLLLASSGVAKLLHPTPSSGALESAGLPSRPWMVRSLGASEIAAALLGITMGGSWLLPAALLYVGFTVFTTWALRSDVPIQSCGCFGRPDTPPTRIHQLYNATTSFCLVFVSISRGPAVPWTTPAIDVILFLVLSAIGAYLSYLLLTVLPTALPSTRS